MCPGLISQASKRNFLEFCGSQICSHLSWKSVYIPLLKDLKTLCNLSSNQERCSTQRVWVFFSKNCYFTSKREQWGNLFLAGCKTSFFNTFYGWSIYLFHHHIFYASLNLLSKFSSFQMPPKLIRVRNDSRQGNRHWNIGNGMRWMSSENSLSTWLIDDSLCASAKAAQFCVMHLYPKCNVDFSQLG